MNRFKNNVQTRMTLIKGFRILFFKFCNNKHTHNQSFIESRNKKSKDIEYKLLYTEEEQAITKNSNIHR
jgi:hypothetical protein